MIRNPILLILAAGASSRMQGVPKGLLLDGQSKPWLLSQLEDFKSLGGTKVIIVLGQHHAAYTENIPYLSRGDWGQWCAVSGLHILKILNSSGNDAFSSVRLASQAMRNQFFHSMAIKPVDTPFPKPEVWKKMLNISTAFFTSSDVRAIIPSYAGKGGHPVLLNREFFLSLAEVVPNSELARLDKQLQSLSWEQRFYLDFEEPSILLNCNTPQDWQQFRGLSQ